VWGSDMSHLHLSISRPINGAYPLTATAELTPVHTSSLIYSSFSTNCIGKETTRTLKIKKHFECTWYVLQVNIKENLHSNVSEKNVSLVANNTKTQHKIYDQKFNSPICPFHSHHKHFANVFCVKYQTKII